MLLKKRATELNLVGNEESYLGGSKKSKNASKFLIEEGKKRELHLAGVI